MSDAWIESLANAYAVPPVGADGPLPDLSPDWGEADEAVLAEMDEAVLAEMRAGEAMEIEELGTLSSCEVSCESAGGVLDDDEMTARGLAVDDDMPKDGRLRWWEIVAWHDSIYSDWVERWRRRPDVRGLAVWHDMDVRDAVTGELKKKHLHIMAGDSHGRKWSCRQALRFARDVFGLRPVKDDKLVRPIKSPSGYALYLTHANAPAKFQYSRDAVMAFGGADLDSVIGVVDNERSVLSDIYAWIDDFYECYGVVPAFAAVVRYANALKPAWARLLASSRGRVVRSYLQSYEFDYALDGRGAKTIRIVRSLIADEKKHAKLCNE